MNWALLNERFTSGDLAFAGVGIQDLDVKANTIHTLVNSTVFFNVSWSQGSDVNFTIDYDDGHTFFWNWLAQNHTYHYDAITVPLNHRFFGARDFTVNVTAVNEVGTVSAIITVTIQPYLNEVFLLERLYTPVYPPTPVEFRVSMIKGSLDEWTLAWCTLVDHGVEVNSLVTVIKRTRSATLRHTFNYTDPDVTPTFICYNNYSSATFSPLVILQQNITGLKMVSPRYHWSTMDDVKFVITVERGSDVHYIVDYLDGIKENLHHLVKRAHTELFNYTHNFTHDGNFQPTIYAYNKYFNASATLDKSMSLKNPVRALTMNGSRHVLYPPGTATFYIIPYPYLPYPTNATCKVDRNPSGTYAPDLREGVTYQEYATYTRDDVDKNTALVSCWNDVSMQNMTFNFTVYEKIDLSSVTATPLAVVTNSYSTVHIDSATGSHVFFNVTFGDGEGQGYHHPLLFASEAPMSVNHTYSKVGNFSAQVYAFNVLSHDSHNMTQIVVVQNKLINLTLSANESVLWTPGLVDYELLLGEGQENVTDVHCLWTWGDNLTSYTYYPSFQDNDIKRMQHTFARKDCGLVNTSISCWNLVSNVTTGYSVNVILDAVRIKSLWINQTVLLSNMTFYVLTLERYGTHSCFFFDFGDNSTNRVIYGAITGTCRDNATDLGLMYYEIPHNTTVIKLNHTYEWIAGFDVSVYAYNHLTYDTITSRTVVLDLPCDFPNITFLANGTKDIPLEYRRSMRIIFRPEVKFDCRKTFLFNITWKAWRVIDGGNKEEPITLNLPVDIPPKLNKDFPAQLLPYGVVRVQLNVSMFKVEGMWSTKDAYFNIGKTDLVVEMAGGSQQAIGWNRTIEINTIDRTSDPDWTPNDRQGWTFRYYCRRTNENFTYAADGNLSNVVPTFPPHITSESLINGTDFGGCFLKGPGGMNFTAGKFTLNTGDMLLNTTYVIRVEARRDTRMGYFEKHLQVLPGDPPVLDIK